MGEKAVPPYPWVTLARSWAPVLRGLAGEKAYTCAYVKSDITSLPYFSSMVTFGKNGVEKVHGIGNLSAYEQGRLDALTPVLKEEIQAGLDYAAENSFAAPPAKRSKL